MIKKILDYDINYIDEGKGDVILLLHGWGSNLNCFTNLISLLKTKYRVIALDYPGFGKSSELKKSFCLDDYVNLILEFIKSLDINEVTLIGHSYGCRIILKLNSRDDLSFLIKKNVLIDAAGLKDKKDFKTKFKIRFYKTLKKIVYTLPLDTKKREELEFKMKSKFGSSDYVNAPKFLQETLVKSVNEDLTNLVPNMKETLLVWGDKDKVTPIWMAKYMESNIKNAGLVVLNGGHFSFLDDEFVFFKVMKSYFNIL